MYPTNAKMVSLLKRIMSAMSLRSSKVHPAPEVIRAPSPTHIFWSATRTRRFARIILNDPKWRGTYDKNIRILDTTYSKLVGQKNNPRLFMYKVNPVAFALALGMEPQAIKRLLPDAWFDLYRRLALSKCEHCRLIGQKMRV